MKQKFVSWPTDRKDYLIQDTARFNTKSDRIPCSYEYVIHQTRRFECYNHCQEVHPFINSEHLLGGRTGEHCIDESVPIFIYALVW